jgi:hypothetical protein
VEWVAREGKRTESFHGGAKGGVFKYQQNECSMGHDLFDDMLPTDCRRSQLLVRSGVWVWKKKLFLPAALSPKPWVYNKSHRVVVIGAKKKEAHITSNM